MRTTSDPESCREGGHVPSAKHGLREAVEQTGVAVGLKSPTELVEATEHSFRGILFVLFGEKAFRTDLVIFAACAVAAVAIPGLSRCERALMIYTAFFPLIAEFINTAIEKTVDRISLERHRLSGMAKDIGSALVLLSFIGAGLCWLVILLGLVF